MLNVILFRGLLGRVYSTGLDVLSLKLQKLPNVDYIVVDGYDQWRSWKRHFEKWTDPTVLIGHSFGANAALRFARETNKAIPLVVTLDTSSWPSVFTGWGPGYVPDNVKNVINYYQGGELITGRALKRVDGTERGIKNHFIDARHDAVEDIPSIHDVIIKEVDKLENKEKK